MKSLTFTNLHCCSFEPRLILKAASPVTNALLTQLSNWMKAEEQCWDTANASTHAQVIAHALKSKEDATAIVDLLQIVCKDGVSIPALGAAVGIVR